MAELLKLEEILTLPQLRKVVEFIAATNIAGLRTYLKSIEPDLLQKGVLPDYLYYHLCYIFDLT